MIGSVVQFAAISLLLGIGSYMDIKTREIPNWIIVIIALTAVINFRLDNLWGIIVAVIFFSVALATGKIGGGDVKLIAALSVVCTLGQLRVAPFRADFHAYFLCGKIYSLQN